MNPSVLLSLVVPLTNLSHAGLKSEKALSTQLKNEVFQGELTKGYHFNEKAPNKIQLGDSNLQPQSLEPQKISFQFKQGHSPAVAMLYVCDDAVTFCETHQIEIPGHSGKAKMAQRTNAFKSKKTPRDQYGFLENDFAYALSEAKKRKVPVIAEFGAIWCPGCVRYESDIFPKLEFAKLTANFIKVRIDVDQFENSPLLKKYDIQGIPALLVLNSEGEEIARILDFQPFEKLSPFLAEVQQDPTTIQTLQSKNHDPALKLRLARRYMASGRPGQALPLLESLTPQPPELLQARVSAAQSEAAQDKAKEGTFLEVLRKAIQSEPKSSRSLQWRTLLIEANPNSPEAIRMRSEGVALAEDLLKNPEHLKVAIAQDDVGEFTGLEKFMIAFAKANLIESSNASETEKTKAWSDTADIALTDKVPERGPGPALRVLSVLGTAKRWSDAEKLVDSMLLTDPQNFDVRRRKVKILKSLNKNEQAVQMAEILLKEARGRNEFLVAQSLADLYIAGGRPQEAKQLLQVYLKRPEIETELLQSSRKSMQDSLESLAKLKP